MPRVVLVGSLDTKGHEYAFACERLRAVGLDPLVIDFGIIGEPTMKPDVTSARVAAAAGSTLEALRGMRDEPGGRARAIDHMARGVALIVRECWAHGDCAGILGFGGGQGSTVISAAMRALPVGVPKVLVSTMSPDNVGLYFGTTDLCLMYAVTDIAGLNRISRTVLANAANAVAGMIRGDTGPKAADRPLVAISMFGSTTKGVTRIQGQLDDAGFETIVFHAVGSGGRAMEEMVDSGLIDGVIDFTPSEITDEVLGGIFSSGPTRLEAAGKRGLPQVVVPGALGQITLGAESSVPARLRGPGRKMVVHNPSVTIVRANAAECQSVGRVIAAKLSVATGAVAVVIPLRGLSDYEAPGGPLDDPVADAALFAAIKEGLPARILVMERDQHINDPDFADLVATTFIQLAAGRSGVH